MKRSAALVIALMGCTGDDPGMQLPPGDELPPGVWEPMPGAPIVDAHVAADGDTVWWALARREPIVGSVYSNWLTATTPHGDAIVTPTEITPDNPSGYDPNVLVTPGAIVTKVAGVQALLRRYAHDGSPLGPPYPISIDAAFTNVNRTQLVATADGGAQLVATLQASDAEVAIVDIDASGAIGATHIGGSPDAAEPGGSVAYTIAAAARPDGTTLVAWDRNYDHCISARPSTTLTTVFDGASVGALTPVRDLPADEAQPLIASSGDTAYIAWLSYTGSGTRLAVARYPDVTNVLAELGGDTAGVAEARIALSTADRGAIAWRPNAESGVYVTAFEDRGGTLLLGAPHLVTAVDPAFTPRLMDLVSTGDDRYVLGWIESGYVALDEETHLYATQLDVAGDAMRPAPTVVADVSVQPRRERCH